MSLRSPIPVLAALLLPWTGAASTVTPPHPARPNISMEVPHKHSVVVNVVNMTKWTMRLVDGSSELRIPNIQQPVQSYDYPGFVFLPGGIPQTIPAQKGTSGDPKTEVYLSARPFVFVWQDGGSGKKAKPEVNLTYQMDNVESYPTTFRDNCGNTGQPGNVKIHIEFDRIKTGPPELKSEILDTVVSGVMAIAELASFVVEGNPVAFVGFVKETKAFVTDIMAINKEKNDYSDTAFFNAYAVSCDGDLDKTPAFVTHPASGIDNEPPQDGVGVQQGSVNGNPQENLVVAQYLLRVKGPTKAKFDGRLPVLSIVVMTKSDWTAGRMFASSPAPQYSMAGAQISNQIRSEGIAGKRRVLGLVRSMNPKDVDLLLGAYKDLGAKKKLNEGQEQLLRKFADAYKARQTTFARDRKG